MRPVEPPLPHIQPKYGQFLDKNQIRDKDGHGKSLTLRAQLCYKFRFKASNNDAKYEVLLTSCKLAKEMQVKRLTIMSDS